jgi:hypothetical protein
VGEKVASTGAMGKTRKKGQSCEKASSEIRTRRVIQR